MIYDFGARLLACENAEFGEVSIAEGGGFHA